MKGNDRVLAELNERLAEELTAISQYMVHSEMCENWGYGRLHKAIRAQALDEMHHAESLIERILFLEGTPTVSRLNPMKIGASVADMIENDREDEVDAVVKYNASIALASEVGDNGTRELFEKILKDEEGHVDWGEEQRDQIAQMGVANYLANQAVDEG